MKTDKVLLTLADYICDANVEKGLPTARWTLLDSVGCAIQALEYKECHHLLGSGFSGNVPAIGSKECLDPLSATFHNGLLIRWLDFNDTWLAKEWGHPSDNLASVLAAAAYRENITMKEVLLALIKAYEVQGILALENSLNAVGFDHVLFVKVATAGVCTSLLGGDKRQVIAALSQAFIDTGPLRTYRHAPCTGQRKSWAAADAARRGLELAFLTLKGEPGYPQVLSAPKWGFEATLLQGKPLILAQPLDTYVMDNILFKIAYPAEFHGQTAIEAAVKIRARVEAEEIESIAIHTQEAGKRIIDKEGALRNPADRDHCIQYMVAVALLEGEVRSEHYREPYCKRPEIGLLMDKMKVSEDELFTKDYHDPKKRAIPNRVTVKTVRGETISEEMIYPLGHRTRREEAYPLLLEKLNHKGLEKILLEPDSLTPRTLLKTINKNVTHSLSIN